MYKDLLFLAAAVVFIVDCSGFSDTIRAVASVLLRHPVREVKPLTCSLCMTFWTCNLYALIAGGWSLAVLAYICALCCLTRPAAELALSIRDGLIKLISKI